ncbi:MAG: hypothetical protein Q8S41_09295 [Lutibacter sp.]|nr:hypothetical protein [Lutibacter sp.]
MRITITIILVCLYSISFSQSLSESDIKKIAQKTNNKIKGVEIGNGITARGCLAIGRTLAYQYDVSNDWSPSLNMKEDLMENFKEAGISEVYFNNDINVDFYYYYGNKLRKKISIKSKEFSNLNFKLGDYESVNGHLKAKGVNLKLRKPNGWELQEGDRPNIVKKFSYKTNSYIILIKDNMMFLSRNEAKDLLSDSEYVKEIIIESGSYLKNIEILHQKIVTIDTYPALEFTIRGDKERLGLNLKMIMKNWMIFYEDKIISFSSGGFDSQEFYSLENLYDSITNSVIFPEQYN